MGGTLRIYDLLLAIQTCVPGQTVGHGDGQGKEGQPAAAEKLIGQEDGGERAVGHAAEGGHSAQRAAEGGGEADERPGHAAEGGPAGKGGDDLATPEAGPQGEGGKEDFQQKGRRDGSCLLL